MLIYSIVCSGLKALSKLELSFDIEADPYFFMSGTGYHHFPFVHLIFAVLIGA